MANLEVKFCGLTFRNPILTAAGPGAKDAHLCAEAAKGGAGGLVTKTISAQPAEVPRPCMAVTNAGFLNTELWSEHSAEHWVSEEYPAIRALGLPVIVGLGYTKEQIEKVAPMVKPYADAVEMSVHYVGTDMDPMLDALHAAQKALDVPVFMKMSPHTDMVNIAKACVEAGVSGLAMINSVGPCMSIDLRTGLPVMGSTNGYGWLTGRAIRPIAVRTIFDVAREVDIPIIGVGGVASGEDAAEMMMAGASLVQVCTEAILKGPTIYGKIASELGSFLDAQGYRNATDIVGLVHKNMADRKFRTHAEYPYCAQEKCRKCQKCVKSCVYEAIEVTDAWRLDEERCFGCGLCVTACPFGALEINYK